MNETLVLVGRYLILTLSFRQSLSQSPSPELRPKPRASAPFSYSYLAKAYRIPRLAIFYPEPLTDDLVRQECAAFKDLRPS